MQDLSYSVNCTYDCMTESNYVPDYLAELFAGRLSPKVGVLELLQAMVSVYLKKKTVTNAG